MSGRLGPGRPPGARAGADAGTRPARGRTATPLRGDGACEEAEDGRSAPFGTSLVAQVGGHRE